MIVYVLIVLGFLGNAKPLMASEIYPDLGSCQKVMMATMDKIRGDKQVPDMPLYGKCLAVKEPIES